MISLQMRDAAAVRTGPAATCLNPAIDIKPDTALPSSPTVTGMVPADACPDEPETP